MGSGPRLHRSGLTQELMVLFKPRDEMKHLPPMKKPTQKLPLSGIASYVERFANPGEAEYKPADPVPRALNRKERKVHAKEAKTQKGLEATQALLQEYDPKKNDKATGDAYHTLFVAKLDYGVTEEDLRKIFEDYGKIDAIHIVKDQEVGHA